MSSVHPTSRSPKHDTKVQKVYLVPEHDRQDDQGDKEGDNDQVKDGVLDDDSSSLCLLLEREDGRSDLSTRSEPEEHRAA